MIEITYDSARAGLEAIIEQEGADFVYQQHEEGSFGSCRYVHDGRPDCIVGRFLSSVGVPLERLEVADAAHFGTGAAAAMLLRELESEELIKVDSRASLLLAGVQHLQDQCLTWGEALRDATAIYS